MAGFSVESFKAQIDEAGGVARSNRFFVSFNPPAGLGSDIGNRIEYFCESTNMPGYQLALYENKRWTYGPSEKRPYAPSFNSLQFTINGDGSGSLWKFFRRWMDFIQPTMASRGMGGTFSDSGGSYSPYELRYKNSYKTDIAIYHLTETEEIITRTVCFDCFPSVLVDQNFDWSDANRLAKFGVRMEFVDATIEAISGEGGNYVTPPASTSVGSGSK